MSLGSFDPYLSGFTSDHTYQSATVETETFDHKKISLTGMTWDLLNQGYAASSGVPSNNPFNLNETADAYEERKRKQLKFLTKKIQKAGLDFVFLQEVDIFTGTPLPKMVAEFLAMLKQQGWRVVHSDRADNLIQPMLILYDGAKLKYHAKRALFTCKSGKNTGLEAEFDHIDTGAQICLTNIYLDTETDHNNAILSYQKDQIKKEKFTIIGGGTNAENGVEYHVFVGDKNVATSVASLMAEDENGK